MVVVGGLGSFAGPVLGAVVIGGISVLLNASANLQTVIFAGSLYVVMLVMPGGLADASNRGTNLSSASGEGPLDDRFATAA